MEVIRLYVDGVHCANCLKKIDSLKSTLRGLKDVDFEMSSNTLRAQVDPTVLKGADLCRAVQSLGFSPQIMDSSEDQDHISRQNDRADLIRIGVAALAAGNIMLMAIAVYAGAQGSVADFMNFLSFLLALPAVIYSAWPIHRLAFSDLVQGRISVDLPISAAIFCGFFLSTWSLWVGAEHIYFDSVAALILLVLASRYLLRRVQKKFLHRTRFQSLFQIDEVLVKSGQTWLGKTMGEVKPGDIVKVPMGAVIPVDGILIGPGASVDSSLLSGEIRPVELRDGDTLYLGMKNLSDEIHLRVTESFSESRLNRLLHQVESALKTKPRSIELLDRVGQAFMAVVFLAAIGTLTYFWSQDPYEGAYRALALVLVACPCTFAFGAPMVFSLAMAKMAECGALIKHANVFEKLLNVKSLVLDKTGTLTDGRYDIQTFQPLSGLHPKDLSVILSACDQSNHPVSRALARHLRQVGVEALEDSALRTQEGPTRGLMATYQGCDYLINKSGAWRNGEPILQLEMGDRLWPDAKLLVKSFQKMNWPVYLLSGDSPDRVHQISTELELPSGFALASQTPEAKQEFLTSHPRALMLGDGANDSLALAKAYVGVAVKGSLSSTLSASDIYLVKERLDLIPRLIQLSRKVNRILKRNLFIAVTYNFVAGSLAILGYIHPLLAAILMPLSSLTQLVSGLTVLRGKVWK